MSLIVNELIFLEVGANMTSIKRILFTVLLIGMFVTVSTVFVAADDGEAFLPGITVTDDHPNGCVDCHSDKGGGRDYRLNTSLAEEGHVKIDSMVKTLPDDCMMCHKEGSKAKSLSIQVHEAHYGEAEENHFISSYQGACLQCHTLNVATGVMSIKSGPKNW